MDSGKRRRAKDGSHGRFVDGHMWRCQPCRTRDDRYSTRNIRHGSVCSQSHYTFREIIPQIYSWCYGLEDDATALTRVGAPVAGKTAAPAHERKWVRLIRDYCFEWCLNEIPDKVRSEMEVRKEVGVMTRETELDYFALFCQAHPNNTFQHLLALIRRTQEAKQPQLFLS